MIINTFSKALNHSMSDLHEAQSAVHVQLKASQSRSQRHQYKVGDGRMKGKSQVSNALIMGGTVQATAGFHHQHHPCQSLNRQGHWGTTDDFTTSYLQFSPFSTALWDFANSRPVHSLMLSSHHFFRPPCLLPPFTLFTMVRRSS